MERGDLQRLALLLNCKTMEVSFVYLGMPVGANPRKKALWEPLIKRLEKKLASLKSKTISFGGKICLLRSVLSSIPLFYLSFFKLPKGVSLLCKKIQKSFLWGGPSGERKVAWVKWEQVCKSKSEGGLGVKDIEAFNNALLLKWRWRLLVEEGGLWSKI